MPVSLRRVIEPLEHVTSKPMHCVYAERCDIISGGPHHSIVLYSCLPRQDLLLPLPIRVEITLHALEPSLL
jgi:hypothetical protein